MYTIYSYTNTVNGKIYIGQTRSTLEHRANKGRGYVESRHFGNAIKKYGWDAFKPDILAQVKTAEEANDLEKYYIKTMNSRDPNVGYNIDEGGKNHEPSQEWCKAISDKAKERYKDKTKNPMYGKKHTPETLQKMRDEKTGSKNPMYGKHWTEKQYEAAKHREKPTFTDEWREHVTAHILRVVDERVKKPVHCIEDDLNFASTTEAADHYGVKVCTLCDHLKGRSKTCRNKHFEYINKNKQ